MTGSSRVLTVSYGTFSCTLEGFDDPFSTMKMVAEYFRDLAAEDRFFGSEPPTPDPEMLYRIAESTARRRIAAEVQENGVVLRQTSDEMPDAAPAQADPAQADPAPVAAPVAAPAPAMTPAAAAPEIAPEAEAAQPDAEAATVEETEEQAVAAPVEAVAEEAAPAVAEAPEPRVEPEPEPEPAAEAEAEPVAAEDSAGDSVATEDATETTTKAEAEAEPAAPAAAPVAEETAQQADAASEEDERRRRRMERKRRLREEQQRRAAAALAATAATAAAVPAEAPETEAEMVAETVAETGTAAEAEADAAALAAALATDATDAPESAAPEAEAEAEAVVETEGTETEAATETETETETETGEPEAAPPSRDPEIDRIVTGAGLSAEDEDELARELAALSAMDAPEAGEAEAADTEAADTPNAVAQAGAGEIDPDTLLAGELASADRIDRRRERAAAALEMPGTDPAIERLMMATRSRMDGPEGERRRNAISQLKAAVAATEAERRISGTDTRAPADLDAYREDFTRAHRRQPDLPAPRREEEAAAAPAPRPTGPAPLVLVSEQRIDREARPARATAQPGGGEGASSFADYVEQTGAHALPDLLEAAAAYTAYVEGRPRFSRAHVITKLVSGEGGTTVPREQGLRTFGQLLREGRILRVQDGQFAIAQGSRFAPEHRIAAAR